MTLRLPPHPPTPTPSCSLASTSFEGDPSPYYLVGTAVQGPDEAEPSRVRGLLPLGGEGF